MTSCSNSRGRVVEVYISSSVGRVNWGCRSGNLRRLFMAEVFIGFVSDKGKSRNRDFACDDESFDKYSQTLQCARSVCVYVRARVYLCPELISREDWQELRLSIIRWKM